MPYGGKFLIRRSVRIIPAHKKHRRSGRCPSGAAIYADEQKSLSRPIIGHTPRKLPPCGAISRFIAVANASGCAAPFTRVPTYNKGKIPLCQGDFSILSTKFSLRYFCSFCRSLSKFHAIVFTVPTNSGTLLLSKITNRNGLIQVHLHSGRRSPSWHESCADDLRVGRGLHALLVDLHPGGLHGAV